MKLPLLTRAQAQRLDELLPAKFGISIPQLMELAGYQVARLAQLLLLPQVKSKGALVLVGPGHNGGDALVAARYLHAWSWTLSLLIPKEGTDALWRQHRETAEKLGLVVLERLPTNAPLVIDGLFGFNVRGPLRPPFDALVRQVNRLTSALILSIDVPSGMDPDTGRGLCVGATHTLALSAPKKESLKHPSELWVADLGIPAEAYREVGVEVPVFDEPFILVKEQDTAARRAGRPTPRRRSRRA